MLFENYKKDAIKLTCFVASLGKFGNCYYDNVNYTQRLVFFLHLLKKN